MWEYCETFARPLAQKVTAQFIPELRLHNKKGPNECQLVETLGPKDPREAWQ